MDRYSASNPVRRRLRRMSRAERLEEAVAFIRQFARETAMAEADLKRREAEVRRAIQQIGVYRHEPDELAFGARVAWRNHARCIGRLTWNSLEVHDCRHVEGVDEVLAHALNGLARSLRGGRIRSSISIFAPATDEALPATFESRQIFQYAGYIQPDGGIVGDRQNIELTNTAKSLGWRPPEQPGPFDLLPVIMRDREGNRLAFTLNADLAREVSIRHPQHPSLDELGLRWYAIPCITDMVLSIGGIDYPCAPFVGHYMSTEIASRNLVDERRYDLLEPIGRSFGLDTSGADTLWRDAALTELNRAVLHSFERDRIRMTDHHRASEQYMEFVKQEQRAGRTPSGDWSWIVPPQASASCPVFHLPMTNLNAVPNFYYSRQLDGGALRLDRSHFREGRWRRRLERLKRRWRDWRRRRDRLWRGA